MPFVIRTLMIKLWGMEYVGLNSLFISIIQILNLSELGFGTALTTTMYKPVEEGDIETVCKIISLYRAFYLGFGLCILIIGIIISPFITFLL